MAGTTKFPAALDDDTTLPDIGPSDQENVSGLEHDVMHSNAHAAIKAIEAELRSGYIGRTTNSGNAYTASAPPATGYVAGIPYIVTFNAANTGAVTLDGYPVYKNGAALTGGEITANADVLLRHDGTRFNFAGDGGGLGGGGGTSGPDFIYSTICGGALL